MAVGNAGKWLRAQQHDSNTGSTIYDVGALLCSMAVGNARKWLRAQQHDSNTGSMMSVHSCVLWLLAMLGNGYEPSSMTVLLDVWCRCTPVFYGCWQGWKMATSSTTWQSYWKYDVGALLCSMAVGNAGKFYELNSMTVILKYDVGAVLCSVAVGNAGKWLRAQQHDSNTGNMMSIHSCVLWLLAMLGNG